MSAVLMDSSWESDGEDAGEDLGEDAGEDYGEDFGEASRRRGRRRPRTNGVKGVRVSTPNGVHNMRFPAKLALAKDTNQGFASLSDRLAKAEARFGTQAKREGAVIGSVTLLLGVPLTVAGMVQASRSGGVSLSNWAAQGSSTIGAVTSATQLATTLSKSLIEKRYHDSHIGVAADIYAGLQLAAYAFGRLASTSTSQSTILRNVLQSVPASALPTVLQNVPADELASIMQNLPPTVLEELVAEITPPPAT
jgi:hypothetical protein